MARHHTDKEIITALRKADGSIYMAAQFLQCERQTIYNRCKKSKKIQLELDCIRDEMIDLAMSNLRNLILKGDAKACFYFLQMFGKDRGYGSSHAYLKPTVQVHVSCGGK